MQRLNEQEITELITTRPGWQFADGRLVRDWSFETFSQAMDFVNQVALIAQDAEHHPDIDIRYNRVRLALTTHDAGGITGRDLEMAGRVNMEFRSRRPFGSFSAAR